MIWYDFLLTTSSRASLKKFSLSPFISPWWLTHFRQLVSAVYFPKKGSCVLSLKVNHKNHRVPLTFLSGKIILTSLLLFLVTAVLFEISWVITLTRCHMATSHSFFLYARLVPKPHSNWFSANWRGLKWWYFCVEKKGGKICCPSDPPNPYHMAGSWTKVSL